ncbi:MAG: sigma-70 family RNA polymerase sigma factor [Bacteroidaceae bacterium]|nr:sigma-70 family RNA polymerase sigma factor [Bacteroidaceae bacterium]
MEKKAFEQSIEQFREAWMELGLRFFGNDADAHDALQETLLRLWVVRHRLQTPSVVGLYVKYTPTHYMDGYYGPQFNSVSTGVVVGI